MSATPSTPVDAMADALPTPAGPRMRSQRPRASSSSLSSSDHREFFALSRAVSAGADVAAAYHSAGGAGAAWEVAPPRKNLRRMNTSPAFKEVVEERGDEGETRDEIKHKDRGESELEHGIENDLAGEEDLRAKKMYDRFSERRKTAIVGIVAYAALLAPYAV